MRNRVLIVGIVVLSLLVMGCSVCGLVGKKGQEVVATKVSEELGQVQEQLATPTPVQEQADKPEATRSAEDDGGAVFEGDQIVSWEALDSYRYELVMQGTQDDEKTSISGGGAFVRQPPAAQMGFEIKSGEDDLQILDLIRVGDQAYLYDADRKGWVVLKADNPMLANMDIVDLMMAESMVQFDKTRYKRIDGHVTVNGLDCSQYRIAAEDIEADLFEGQGEITAGQADVWIANKLGVLIRYELDLEGKDADGKTVDARLTLNVLDVNQPVTISPPPENEILGDLFGLPDAAPTAAPSSSDGIAKMLPRPENTSGLEGAELAMAQAMAETADADMYKVDMSIEAAVAFYDKALADAGWEKMGSSTVTEGIAVLVFGKDGKTATVMINSMLSPEAPMVVVFVQ